MSKINRSLITIAEEFVETFLFDCDEEMSFEEMYDEVMKDIYERRIDKDTLSDKEFDMVENIIITLLSNRKSDLYEINPIYMNEETLSFMIQLLEMACDESVVNFNEFTKYWCDDISKVRYDLVDMAKKRLMYYCEEQEIQNHIDVNTVRMAIRIKVLNELFDEFGYLSPTELNIVTDLL